MRILALISTMGPGGAERAMARLTEALAERHEVSLMTWEPANTPPFYDLSPSVRLVQGGLLGGGGWTRIKRILARFVVIHREVKRWKPDVVLSFIDMMNITTVISCLGTKVPVVVSERTDPSQHRIGWRRSALRLFAYRFADRVVVQTKRVRLVFPQWLRPRIAIIPNAAPITAVAARPDGPNDRQRFRIIGLGRLSYEKGFDRLVSAFRTLAPIHPNWDLVIFGEGPEREALQKFPQILKSEGRILFPGLTLRPSDELVMSHLMVVPSRYEGFPNALAEAIGAGLPVVAMTDVAGVEELVVHGETGVLVDHSDSESGLVTALDRLMTDDCLRAQFGQAARKHAMRWAPESIYSMWEGVLVDVVQQRLKRNI